MPTHTVCTLLLLTSTLLRSPSFTPRQGTVAPPPWDRRLHSLSHNHVCPLPRQTHSRCLRAHSRRRSTGAQQPLQSTSANRMDGAPAPNVHLSCTPPPAAQASMHSGTCHLIPEYSRVRKVLKKAHLKFPNQRCSEAMPGRSRCSTAHTAGPFSPARAKQTSVPGLENSPPPRCVSRFQTQSKQSQSRAPHLRRFARAGALTPFNPTRQATAPVS